jgi:histo-blood group ABO system transferase
MKKIGLLIIATNKYTTFIEPLIKSADDNFLNNQEVTYFIFTNKSLELNSKRDIKYINVEHKDWPWMTLGRYKIFSDSHDELSKMDYLYYCDADMRFVGVVGDEILSDLVATQHPGYYGTKGTPETSTSSLACVYPNEDMQYFAGGFNGGSSYEYLKMSKKISNNIDIDYSNGIIAVWHDESHMNRYFIDNKPTKILNPSYCYGESMNIPFDKKIIALDKNHSEIRSL